MKENQTKTHEARPRFSPIWFLTVGLSLLLSPIAAASPGDCLAYGYTSSGNHQFLIAENTSQFGDNLTIITNCDNLTVEIDGKLLVQTSRNVTVGIDPGLHNVSIWNNDFSSNFSNVMFYPDYLQWELTYQFETNDQKEFVDAALIDAKTNWAVFIGVLIVWVLCVYVYWNLINTFVQKNFIEEVVQ